MSKHKNNHNDETLISDQGVGKKHTDVTGLYMMSLSIAISAVLVVLAVLAFVNP